jgi:hypothetical protein
MNWVLPIFKAVNIIFAISAVGTGVQAIADSRGFSESFGIPISNPVSQTSSIKNGVEIDATPAASYVALMGARQLGTGLTLLVFAFQRKWVESATILLIIGIIVAGTDGLYLARSGASGKARFHAIPGALIALLAGAVVFTTA